MDYVRLGSTGLKVSRLCLGTMTYGTPAWRPWILDEAASRPFYQRAHRARHQLLRYRRHVFRGESEEVLGRALKELATRDEVVIATKVFYPATDASPTARGLSRKHIMEAIDASLTPARHRLRRPLPDPSLRSDYTPIEETLEALHDVVKAGKALYIGASSMYAWQFANMLATQRQHGWTRFVTMQNHYNLVYREEEREMIPLCATEGIGVIPWSPLARGFLAGNRKRGEKSASLREQHDDYGHSLYYADCDYDVADRVVEVAKQKGVLPIQVALSWVANRPGVTAPIVSATKMEQLDQLVAGLDVTLTDAEQKAVEEVYVPHPVLGTEP